MKCDKIDHPNIQSGWGCCQCRIFNGDQRIACKQCGHSRCDDNNEMIKSFLSSKDKVN